MSADGVCVIRGGVRATEPAGAPYVDGKATGADSGCRDDWAGKEVAAMRVGKGGRRRSGEVARRRDGRVRGRSQSRADQLEGKGQNERRRA